MNMIDKDMISISSDFNKSPWEFREWRFLIYSGPTSFSIPNF